MSDDDAFRIMARATAERIIFCALIWGLVFRPFVE